MMQFNQVQTKKRIRYLLLPKVDKNFNNFLFKNVAGYLDNSCLPDIIFEGESQ